MATLQELELALVNADKAGDLDAARRLAAVLVKARQDTTNQIPDTIVPGTTQEYVEPSLGEKIVGAGETALTLATGATGGTVGMIGGTLKGLAEQILSGQFGSQEAANLVQKSAMQGAQALTYAPHTQSGQEQVQAVGEVLQNVPPVIPAIGPTGAVSTGAKTAAPAVAATAGRVAAPVVAATKRAGQAVAKAAEPIRGMMPGAPTSDVPLRQIFTSDVPTAFKAADAAAYRASRNGPGEDIYASKLFGGDKLKETGLPKEAEFEYVQKTSGQPAVFNIDDLSVSQSHIDLAKTKKFIADLSTGAVMPPVKVVVVNGLPVVVDGHTRLAAAKLLGGDKIRAEILGATDHPAPGTQASGGSAGVDMATMRRVAARELPVPVEVTKGQATRDFAQQRFEQEAAKHPELGAPIRERMEQQNKAVRQSFDAWIDETGAQAPDSRATGIAVDKAVRAKAARDKAEIRVAYKEAEKAGETAQPVSTQSIVDVLNESVSAESTAPVLGAAKKELIRLGGAEEGPNGQLIAKDMTLGNTEQLRKFVNKTTGSDATNIKFAGDLKRAIDASTEGAGGELYAKARGLRARYADQYENHAVISDLLNNKRGTADRRVALEDVADRVLYRGSLDDMRFARKVLQTGGEDGIQAWKEIQGAALRDIRDAATKGVSRDSAGNEIISASGLDKAIKRLDSEGKLDYLFGKKGAEQLRVVNDLAKAMFTSPPGAVNTSNTASVLLAALDMAISGSAGMPLPVMSGLKMLAKNVKDRKLRARIQDALGNQKENQ